MEQLLNAELGLRHVVLEGIWIFAAMEACRIAVYPARASQLSKRSG
jgi:hypothetical protein